MILANFGSNSVLARLSGVARTSFFTQSLQTLTAKGVDAQISHASKKHLPLPANRAF
jgi:hypothetical protein